MLSMHVVGQIQRHGCNNSNGPDGYNDSDGNEDLGDQAMAYILIGINVFCMSIDLVIIVFMDCGLSEMITNRRAKKSSPTQVAPNEGLRTWTTPPIGQKDDAEKAKEEVRNWSSSQN